MPTLSRRTLVTGAATLPALAVPALAIADPSNADARLLRLGAKLDRIGEEWLAQRALDRREHEAADAACEQAGLPCIEFGSLPPEEYRAYQGKRGALS